MSNPIKHGNRTLPTDARSGRPIEPKSQPGYYPGFSTLSQQDYWDEATRKVILQRVNEVPQLRFFSPDQARLLTAICDRIIPQDDRDTEHRIPIVPFIDERLHLGKIDGYRFETMPSDREAYQLGLQAIDAAAHDLHGAAFVDLSTAQQEEMLKRIHDGDPPSDHEVWKRMSVHRFWLLLVQDCVGVYYSHPFAWDEIGFGGPAYPRAYMRLEGGQAEPWEVNEKRYEWQAPPDSVSDRYEPVGKQDEHHGSPGQGGTH